MDGSLASRPRLLPRVDLSFPTDAASGAWRLCGEGATCSYRPPARAPYATAVACSELRGEASRRSREGHTRRGAATALGGGALSAAALGWMCAPALAAERLFPPLSGGGSGGSGGGGGGAGRGAAAAKRRPGCKRVMILMSDTGGGHRASAEALKAAFEIKFGNQFQTSIVDLWSHHAPYPTNRLPKSYNFLVKHAWLWRLNFEWSSFKLVHNSMFAAYGAVVSRMFSKAFDTYAPDLVVSVHPLMQHIPIRVLQRRRANTGIAAPPFATVVTDLTSCHPTWFHKGVAACFVPTQQVAAQARRAGLSPSQIVQHGLPIRPAFAAPLPAKPKLRRQLGLAPDGPVILLMGGGEGMGLLEPTAMALAQRLPPAAQVVVVCGRNAPLAQRLAARAASFQCKLHVKGFLSNVDEWMGASDVVITKAGPGTIAEALIRGLPLMLNGAIPCQEEGNVPFVLENGVGRFSTDPDKIALQIADWCGPAAAELAAMAKRAKALGRPHATFDIVKDLAALTV